ncbi:AraC family transcriptional regulator [uncultured Tateyamaria sp.]|uniref:helix-turn-helix domain-containing protein n=1 Tax=Tateyamaria sp. 1078 TaxID=3417464 RepID=UPI002626CACB|nr:AraC family transcriptional regulator [uncultured Tateyamaria sp.]
MSFDPLNLLIASVVATFAVASLAAMVCWSQRRSIPSRTTLALFFAAFALSEVDSLAFVLTAQMPQGLRDGTGFLNLVVNFCIMPLFLLYVRELLDARGTSDSGPASAFHVALPATAAFVSVIGMAMPAATREAWYTGATTDTPGLVFLQVSLTLLTIALVLQWAVYVIWIAQTQSRHIARLKQHFASTEGMEQRWIAVLAFAMGFYILQTMAGETLVLLGGQDPVGPLLDSFLVLVVVVVVALWGLRPSPELDHATQTLDAAEPHCDKKYEKSALGADQAGRIARKLIRAMQQDQLYRDPNLTLSTLSSHVGVSLNYVSQTLNQHLHQSFFEFVNDWRVKEAIPMVKAGETTVLAIAYEVGFNSRSSFYSAFKRVTGVTPTAYKNARHDPARFPRAHPVAADAE